MNKINEHAFPNTKVTLSKNQLKCVVLFFILVFIVTISVVSHKTPQKLD